MQTFKVTMEDKSNQYLPFIWNEGKYEYLISPAQDLAVDAVKSALNVFPSAIIKKVERVNILGENPILVEEQEWNKTAV